MQLLTILGVLFFTFNLNAETLTDADKLNLPIGLELMSEGYPAAPIIQCPRPSKKYVDMLAQLDLLKNRIKSEACRNSGEIEAIESGVTDLQNLVTDKRVAFIDIIKKGTSPGQQLSNEEVQNLENYIDQVVKKASVVTGFLNNEACFDEPAKFSALGTLSAVIGEVSGAVGALAGPFGAKISLAGSVVSGLLKSMNTIVTARKSYDQDVEMDRVNYLNTLCAYYDFKTDFDKETKTLAYDRRLRVARDSAQNLIEAISVRCPGCMVAAEDFQDRFYNERGFMVSRGKGVKAFSEQLQADELGPNDLINRYFPGTYSEYVAPTPFGESGIVEPAPAVSESDQKATVTALLTKAWAETERQKLMEGEDFGDSDELRKPIVNRQNEIESVLFRNVAPDYIKYHERRLVKDHKDLLDMGRRVISQLYSYRPLPDPDLKGKNFDSTLAIAFHEVFRSNLEFAESVNPLMSYEGDVILDFVEQMAMRMMDQFDVVRRQYALTHQRCEFFENSLYDIRRSPSLKRACDRARSVMKKVSQELAEVGKTSFGVEFPYYFQTFSKEDSTWAADWLESVTRFMSIETASRL